MLFFFSFSLVDENTMFSHGHTHTHFISTEGVEWQKGGRRGSWDPAVSKAGKGTLKCWRSVWRAPLLNYSWPLSKGQDSHSWSGVTAPLTICPPHSHSQVQNSSGSIFIMAQKCIAITACCTSAGLHIHQRAQARPPAHTNFSHYRWRISTINNAD